MMQVVGQNAADQQRRREIHQTPPARKRFVLPTPHLQRGEQAEKRREHLRHIVQIPQVAVDLSSFKEAVFHRAQKQPQHRHRAAEHQIAPHPSMQDSMRNGKSPRHGQPDVDQVGQQEEHGGWQRRGGTIELAKHAGEDEQPERQTEFRHRAPFNASHSPTSHLNRADRRLKVYLLYHKSAQKASVGGLRLRTSVSNSFGAHPDNLPCFSTTVRRRQGCDQPAVRRTIIACTH